MRTARIRRIYEESSPGHASASLQWRRGKKCCPGAHSPESLQEMQSICCQRSNFAAGMGLPAPPGGTSWLQTPGAPSPGLHGAGAIAHGEGAGRERGEEADRLLLGQFQRDSLFPELAAGQCQAFPAQQQLREGEHGAGQTAWCRMEDSLLPRASGHPQPRAATSPACAL